MKKLEVISGSYCPLNCSQFVGRRRRRRRRREEEEGGGGGGRREEEEDAAVLYTTIGTNLKGRHAFIHVKTTTPPFRRCHLISIGKHIQSGIMIGRNMPRVPGNMHVLSWGASQHYAFLLSEDSCTPLIQFSNQSTCNLILFGHRWSAVCNIMYCNPN